MNFSSSIFLFIFFPIVLFGYFLLRKTKEKYQNWYLLFFSLLFFMWNQPQYLLLLLGTISVDYVFGLWISKASKRKPVLVLCIFLNLLPLLVYKYFDFFVETENRLLSADNPLLELVLPIGISFYTFQAISYVVDVYRGQVLPQKNFISFALYISFFPQLVAGPIVRYSDISKEIESRTCTAEDRYDGIMQFISGLAKKSLIANRMAAIVDAIWLQGSGTHSAGTAWIGIICFALQIYYDFSGYSDMAIGMGRMMGFHFPQNFNLPYCAKSITDFWRRWHISLSSWFRDYVYIPLGGNRKNEIRNLLVVFLLTGLWHGARWTFVFWGLFFFVLIVFEKKVLLRKNREAGGEKRVIASVLMRVYTLFFVTLGWVLFRAGSILDAAKYLGNMFGVYRETEPVLQVYVFSNIELATILLGVVFASPLPGYLKRKWFSGKKEILFGIGMILILLLSLARIMTDTSTPFIYFQF